jgi:16S rRNA (uracil1498-N3)-methyltransferase
LCILSGPEGGLTDEEEAMAVAQGFMRVSLGPHTLRAETAPLVVLSQLLCFAA